MKPVNIFRISRIRDEELFNIAAKHEADDHDNHRVRIHEINSLRILADALFAEGVTLEEFDGFYFGFIIPQIGKEFDLLKVTGGCCLNIELKSQDVTEEHIRSQLLRNSHYLNHLGRPLCLYTVVTDTLTCYRLDPDGKLVSARLSEIASAVHRAFAPYDSQIEKSFSTTEYLITPESDPEKLLQEQYFLTPAQEYVKKELLRDIGETTGCAFFNVTGKPCTGKTLLVYDLARTLSEQGRVLIITREKPSEGLAVISRAVDHLDFVSASSLPPYEKLSDYTFLLVDESLRLSDTEFVSICASAHKNAQICIFSTDPDAVLTGDERAADITGKILDLKLDGEYVLSEKLRMNMEIHTFIRKLRYLGCKVDKTFDYDDISVNYAGSVSEAREMIRYYRAQGYVFIDSRADRSDGVFADYQENFISGHIAGREYEKAVILMDDSFSYDSHGHLCGIPVPDPDNMYPNIFYQGITRVRENLALIIMDAPELLRSILSIID